MQGQPVCSYYSLYGICNYGPACRFDHPVDRHNYAYSLRVPPTAFAYPAPAPYQRIASQLPVTDVSPAKSSKLSDWIKKETTASNKHHQNSNTKSLGESLEQSDSKASSDVLHDESDWRAVAQPAVTTLWWSIFGWFFFLNSLTFWKVYFCDTFVWILTPALYFFMPIFIGFFS